MGTIENTTHPNAFARASTSASPRGARAPVSPCLYPCPRTHGNIRGETAQGGAPAIPTLIESDKKIEIQRRQTQHQKQHQVHRLYCGVHTSLSRRRSYWLHTSVPELIHILYRRICTWYTAGDTGVFVVYIRHLPVVAHPPSLARRRTCWLYAAVSPATNCCSSNVPGTTYCCCNVLLLL